MFRASSLRSSILTLLGSSHQKPTWNVPIAECTVDNSWWWAEKIPETYRALWQYKIWIISESSWLFNYEIYHYAQSHEYKVCRTILTSILTYPPTWSGYHDASEDISLLTFFLRFEVLSTMTTNIVIIWHVTKFSLVQVRQLCRETFYFHFLPWKQKDQIPPKRW